MLNVTKDPQELLDYAVDWTDWLGADTISDVSWTVPTGITQNSTTNTTKTATIWLSGGTLGNVYRVVCRITTNAGRVAERTIALRIADK